MRTPHYDSDESGSELSSSWLDVSKEEEVDDDDRLSSTASALGSSTISNISPSEVSTDTEGFSLSSDESQPDLDDDDDDDEEHDAESDRDEDRTPAASFNKFTSSFIFPDPANSFSTNGETPVPSIYNVPSEPVWQGIKGQPPLETLSTPPMSNSTAETADEKEPATEHSFPARSTATARSKRGYMTAIASAVVLSLLIKIAPVVLQHNLGALVANTFSTPTQLETIPAYAPPASESTARSSDEGIMALALSALSDQPPEPIEPKPKARSKPTSRKGKGTHAVMPAESTAPESSPKEVTSLSVAHRHEFSIMSASASSFIKDIVGEHFANPMTALTENARNQISNLTAWSYELLVVLSRVTLDFLTREVHLAQSEISQELSRIRAAAEAMFSRRGEVADQVNAALSQSVEQVRQAAHLSTKHAQDAASLSLQKASDALVYSNRKAHAAYTYLHQVAGRSNRKAARGARRVVREMTRSQSSMRNAGSKSAQKAKSQLDDSVAAGVRLVSDVGKKAIREASKGAQNVKHRSKPGKTRCGSKSKGRGSEKCNKAKCGRRSKKPLSRQGADGQKGFWKRNRR